MKQNHSRNRQNANNKYSFEYLLLAIPRNLASLAKCKHFPVMITTIIQLKLLNQTYDHNRKVNTENSIYLILDQLSSIATQIASET